MKNFFNKAVLASTAVGTAISSGFVHAQARSNPLTNTTNLDNVASNAGIQTTNGPDALPKIIGTIINVVLGFMGIVLLFYIILAGWEWMNSGGDSKGADAAKTRIKNAVIGLVIIVSAYAISSFVINQLATLTQ